MYSTRILKDSIAPCDKRLTTWELTYPRFVHAELMTHRLFSRNSASSRAIPTERLLARVREDPAMPKWWGKNQAGMQAAEELDPATQQEAERYWLAARDQMLDAVEGLSKLGLHKQLANRLIEPWMFITVIVSATEFGNWFHLRNHRAAQPEIAWVAKSMWEQYNAHKPTYTPHECWHLPLVDYPDDWLAASVIAGSVADWVIEGVLKKVSVGRCARVSYLTHEGKRDLEKDIELHDRLCSGPLTGEPGHWSPFEHVAAALSEPTRSGNFIGWFQYRKEFTAEHFGGRMP
jgi:thymidylate synthase ThyX